MSRPVLKSPDEGVQVSSIQSPRPLRIGVDASCWDLHRGFGRHTQGLVSALVEIDSRNKYVFFVDGDSPPELLSHHECRNVSNSRSVRNGARTITDIVRTSWTLSR